MGIMNNVITIIPFPLTSVLRRVDNMLLLVSGDKTELRKHKQAYGEGVGVRSLLLNDTSFG